MPTKEAIATKITYDTNQPLPQFSSGVVGEMAQSNPNKENDISFLFGQFIKRKLNLEKQSRVTIKNYRDNFGLLMQFKPDLQIEDLTERTIVDFAEFLNTRPRTVGKEQVVREYKNSSIATVRGKLNPFFNWLVDGGYIETNPFVGIPHPDVSYTDNKAFTADEFDKICTAINTTIQWESLLLKKRNIAFVMFWCLTGVRKEEWLRLQVSDLDMKSKLVTIRGETSKSKRTRVIPINPQLSPYLEDYIQARQDYTTEDLWVSGNEDRGFTEHGAKHLIERLKKVSGVHIHLHRFRHTFAVNYYRQTHDIVGLRTLLGHKSFKMTLVYLRSLTDEDLVTQMQKLSVADFV